MIFKLISYYVKIIAIVEFSGSYVNCNLVSKKIYKHLKCGVIEIRIAVYTTLFLYSLCYKYLLFFTKSQSKTIFICDKFNKVKIFGSTINLINGLIRASIIDEASCA
jgi:hypothetical protein